ncbi:BEM_collapsed_G0013500.mRNA.1.CDS.1 [Saccharomyces cerevisiae]|nr:BEM_collapsed_G0013500.mRNA.1.CDS.1 [Saccharomyces cerevisiae]
MPDSVITETMPLPIVDVSGDGPPLQIYIDDPKKGDQKGENYQRKNEKYSSNANNTVYITIKYCNSISLLFKVKPL